MNNLIYIVDDIALIGDLIQYNFELAGFTNTRTFISPFKCLKDVKAGKVPQIVISDFQMPQMDGVSLLNKITMISPMTRGIIVTDDPQAARVAGKRFPVFKKGHSRFFTNLLSKVCSYLDVEYQKPVWRVALP